MLFWKPAFYVIRKKKKKKENKKKFFDNNGIKVLKISINTKEILLLVIIQS